MVKHGGGSALLLEYGAITLTYVLIAFKLDFLQYYMRYV